MKKVLLLILALSIGGKYVIAQDAENDLKNFRFGLKAVGMITWFKPEDKKKYSSGGTTAKGGYGLSLEFRLNKVASFNTGVQLDYDGGKINFLTTADPNYYFLSRDGELLKYNTGASDSTATRYKINSRTYKSS